MKRTNIALLISAKLCNPNGDPDANNEPRTDPEANTGLITQGCIKRKIRNYIQEKYGKEAGYDIYIKENTVLGSTRLETLKSAGITPKNVAKESTEGKEALEKKFFDIRAFGAVLSGSTTVNCGKETGPAQVEYFETLDPVQLLDIGITRCAAETPEELKKAKDGKSKTMGSKKIIAFGLYKGSISIDPIKAKQTGFTDKDLERLIEATKNMFVLDSSDARPAGALTIEAMVVFTHESVYGNDQPSKLSARLVATKKVESPKASTDYDIALDTSNLPEGISCTRLI